MHYISLLRIYFITTRSFTELATQCVNSNLHVLCIDSKKRHVFRTDEAVAMTTSGYCFKEPTL